MSIDISHLENNPTIDDISDDSVEAPKKKSSLVEHNIAQDDEPQQQPIVITEQEIKEKEFLLTILELYRISFPKLKSFHFDKDMSLDELRSIKKSCDAQLSIGPAIGTYEEMFFQFLSGLEIMLTKKGFDLTGFAYICQQDESVKQDLRLIVIRMAAQFSPRPEFRLLMNTLRIGAGCYYVNHLKAQQQLQAESANTPGQQNIQQQVNNNQQ